MTSTCANQSVQCVVKKCRYHCQDKDYCSLDAIRVGTHELNPTKQQCTDCQSFETK